MSETMNHLLESKQAKEFLKNAGLKIDKSSAHNAVTLVDKDGNKLTLWAESQYSVAGGIPGIFVFDK